MGTLRQPTRDEIISTATFKTLRVDDIDSDAAHARISFAHDSDIDVKQCSIGDLVWVLPSQYGERWLVIVRMDPSSSPSVPRSAEIRSPRGARYSGAVLIDDEERSLLLRLHAGSILSLCAVPPQ